MPRSPDVKAHPKCSVIIPTHNCLAYLPEAVASALMQDVDDIEVIVVDDGSSDGTGEWLARQAAGESRLMALSLDGKGPGFARNYALSRANGHYVAFLDADDFWWPRKLGRQLRHHDENPDLSFSFTDYLHVDTEGALRRTCFDYWKPAYVDRGSGDYRDVRDPEMQLLGANIVGTSAVVAPLRALQNANGFSVDSRSAEDWDLWLRLARGGPVACSPTVTMSYLMRPTSVTQDRGSRIAAMKDIVAPYASRSEPSARRAWRRATSRIDIAEAEQARMHGERWTAARAHFRAFAKWPERRSARAAVADLAAAMRSMEL
jgi:glycosyltransferase involved in cell wall biosynthesis